METARSGRRLWRSLFASQAVAALCACASHAPGPSQCGDAVCKTTQVCVADVCRDMCNVSSDCKQAGYTCASGACVPTATGCSSAAQCGAAQVCVDSLCYDICSTEGDCTQVGFTCTDGVCKGMTTCAGGGCPLGLTCAEGYCRYACVNAGDCAAKPGTKCLCGACEPTATPDRQCSGVQVLYEALVPGAGHATGTNTVVTGSVGKAALVQGTSATMRVQGRVRTTH